MYNDDTDTVVFDDEAQQAVVMSLYRGMSVDVIPTSFAWSDDEQLDSSAHVSVVDGLLALMNVA